MIKISRFKLRQYGIRGYETSLPAVWVRDIGLNKGDYLNFYRTEDNKLVVTAEKEESPDESEEEPALSGQQ